MRSLIGLLAIGALGVMVLGATAGENKAVCHKPADVIFVLDASSSIWIEDFKKQLNFTATIIQDLRIDPSTVRCGVVTYGDYARVEFGLRTYSSTEEAQRAVRVVEQLTGQTRTELALSKMRQMMKEDKRPGVPQIAILITDGDSDYKEKTRLEADVAHKEGITLFAVGIGERIHYDELRSIASQENFVFQVDDFDRLKSIREILEATACDVDSKTSHPTAPITTTQSVKVCQNPADVIFVCDASTSIWNADFKQQLFFMETVVRHLRIESSMVRCGLVTYGDQAHVEFGLRTYSSSETVLKSLLVVRQLTGNTRTDLALNRMRQMMIDDKRPGVPMIGIVITDRDSDFQEKTRLEAETAHKEGISLFAVGIGRKINYNELVAIASQESLMFRVGDFDGLKSILGILMSRMSDVSSHNERTLTPTLSPSVKVCQNPADVIFVCDASTSIWNADFKKQLVFVETVVQHLRIESSVVRCGLVTYGDQVHVDFGLRTYTSSETVLKTLTVVQQLTGNTRTDLALSKMRQMMVDDKRPGVPKIGIVITDRDSDYQEKTRLEAESAHKEGITMFAVGIGRKVNYNELVAIASQESLMFRVGDFDGLNAILGILMSRMSDVSSHNERTLTPTLSPSVEVCHKPADVIFVLDASSSIWPPDFEKQLNFTATVIQDLRIDPSMIRCGLVTYGDRVRVEFGLRTYSSTDETQRAVKAVRQLTGNTRTDLALNNMRQMMVDDKRPGVPMIGIVITDGDSDYKEKTRLEAEAAHKEGITLFAVGIGRKINYDELRTIASQENSVFQVGDFDGLKAIQMILETKVCDVQ